jgi:hypothetical protein
MKYLPPTILGIASIVALFSPEPGISIILGFFSTLSFLIAEL